MYLWYKYGREIGRAQSQDIIGGVVWFGFDRLGGGSVYCLRTCKNMGLRGLCTSSYVDSTRRRKKVSKKFRICFLLDVHLVPQKFHGAMVGCDCVATTIV